jgi:hypothetical protein
MTELNNEIRELNIDELKMISGGRSMNNSDYRPGPGGDGLTPVSEAVAVWNQCMAIARGQ